MDRRHIGTLAENSACAFLEAQGFSIVARNFLRRIGELDVVARTGQLAALPRVSAAPSSAASPQLRHCSCNAIRSCANAGCDST